MGNLCLSPTSRSRREEGKRSREGAQAGRGAAVAAVAAVATEAAANGSGAPAAVANGLAAPAAAADAAPLVALAAAADAPAIAVAAAAAQLTAQVFEEQAAACYGLPRGDEACLHSEEERLAAVRSLNIVRQATGTEFGSVTSLLKLVFDVPSVGIFLFDEHEVLGVPDGPGEPWATFPRCHSHCRYIMEPAQSELLIVEDLLQDMRYRHSIWVTGPPHLRYYASSPLVSTDRGLRYGTLCLTDGKPRHFSAQQYQLLAHFSEVVVRELEGASMLRWRRLQREEVQQPAAPRRLVRRLACFSEGIALCDVRKSWQITYVNTAMSRLTGLPEQQAAGASFWELFALSPRGGMTREDVDRAVASGQPVTVTCMLLPSGSHGGGGNNVGVPTAAAVAALGATECTVTFTQAQGPDFRPDEQPVAIPAYPPGLAPGGGGSSGSEDGAGSSYWFAAVQPQPSPGSSNGSTAGFSGSAGGTPCSPVSRGGGSLMASSLERMRPANMRDVELGSLLGVGASGRAFRGSWYGTEVAVKIVNLSQPLARGGPSNDDDECSTSGVAALLEAALSRALHHPHIVPTHAWGVSEGAVEQGEHLSQVWIVQTLCSLGSLAHGRDRGLFQDPSSEGPLVRSILLTLHEVAAALVFLHALGIVHGDLSPNNVLLDSAIQTDADPRGFTAMVADFGLSRPTCLPSQAVPRGTFGTVTHMAPELLSDDEQSPAVDVYALGVLCWELMAGRRAWRGMGPMQVITAVTMQHRTLTISPEWPSGVKDLIKRCLSHDPALRPTAQAALEQIEGMLQQGGAGDGKVQGDAGGGTLQGDAGGGVLQWAAADGAPQGGGGGG